MTTEKAVLLLLHAVLWLPCLYDWVRPWDTRQRATRHLLHACSGRSREGLRMWRCLPQRLLELQMQAGALRRAGAWQAAACRAHWR